MPLDPQLQAYFGQSKRKLDPQLQAYFGGQAGPAPGQKLDPQLDAYFRQAAQQDERAKPPPIVVEQAPPPPPMPVSAVPPAAAPAPPPEEPGFSWWKALSFLSDPITATLNSAAQAGYASEGRGEGPLQTAGAVAGAIGRALIPDALVPGSDPKNQGAFYEGLTSPQPVAPTMFNRPGRENAPQAERYARAGLNFLGSTVGLDPVGAKLTGALAGALSRRALSAADAAGLLDQAIPLVGKSAKELQEARRLRNLAKTEIVRGAAQAGIQNRKTDFALKEIKRLYTDAQRAGGQSFARVLPDGRRVNKADEWVTHWLEAGSKGATHANRAIVERLAQADGVDPALVRQVAGIVRDRFNETGHWLESVGYLKPGTVSRFGDQYISRMYHMASGNLNDIEAALEAGVKGGWLTPEAEALGRKVMRQSGLGRGAGFAPGKARKVTDAAVGESLGREYQAGVVAANALPKQARIGARFQAVESIAANPELFSKGAVQGWTKAKVGANEGWWNPEALKVLENVDRLASLDQYKALRTLSKTAQFVKSRWVAFNPAVQLGNLKQNIVMAEGAAAARGVHWNGSMLAGDGAEFFRALKDPKGNRFFNELAQRSRAFTGEAGMIDQVGGSLRKSVGIDTPLQKAGQFARSVEQAPGRAFSLIEQASKYSLFKRLRMKGVSADEAAQIVDRALFDHADQNVILAGIQKYGFIPFMGSRLKGLENTLQILTKNPDILIRQSGLRLGQAVQQAAGEEGPLRDPKTGKLQFPFGGDRTAAGQILSQDPFQPLDPMTLPINQPFGAWQSGVNAITNQDPWRRETFPDGGGFIVRPGELPPMDAVVERAKYALEAYAPLGVLTPGIGRGAKRLDRAAAGTTQYGGPTQEPETPMEALLGVFAGIRVKRNETDRQKLFRGVANQQDRLPNQIYLSQYQSDVRSGRLQRQQWGSHMLPKDPRTTEAWLGNATSKLRSYLFGGEDVQGSAEQQAKIRRLADWVMALEDHQMAAFQKQVNLDALAD